MTTIHEAIESALSALYPHDSDDDVNRAIGALRTAARRLSTPQEEPAYWQPVNDDENEYRHSDRVVGRVRRTKHAGTTDAFYWECYRGNGTRISGMKSTALAARAAVETQYAQILRIRDVLSRLR